MSSVHVQPDAAIPVYSLAQKGQTSAAMIELREAKGNDVKLSSDFLIPHRKDYFLFVLVKKGNSRHWIDFNPYTLQPNTFYFTVPSQVHLSEDTQSLQGLILCFTREFLRFEESDALHSFPILQNIACGHELHLRPTEYRFVEDTLRTMLNEFQSDHTWANQMLTSLLRVLVIYLSRLYTQQFGEVGPSPENEVLQSFLELVNQQYATLHDAASYAGLLNITPGYLGAMVKHQTGGTVLAHIHERLAVEAKRRLLHTSLSVKQIAEELGFQDAPYFNRFFRRITETTPAAYREHIRKMYH